MSTNVSFDVGRDEAAPRPAIPAERRYQELWFALAGGRWASLVLVPTDPGGSCAGIARSLAEVGNRVSDVRVTAVTVDALEYVSAHALVELQRRTVADDDAAGDNRPALVHVTATRVDADNPRRGTMPRAHGGEQVPAPVQPGRLVIAIPSVLSEPLGLALVARAGAVVLCIDRGRTRVADARRTIELVGRERIAGCFLVG